MEANELLAALAEHLGIELKFDADGACSFSADEMTVTINRFAEFDAIALSGDLGLPPPESLETLYKAMLEANYLFAGTAGATLSRNPDTGHLALCLALQCKALSADGFYAATERFVSALESWSALIANFRPVFEAAEEAETKAPYFGMDGFVQV